MHGNVFQYYDELDKHVSCKMTAMLLLSSQNNAICTGTITK